MSNVFFLEETSRWNYLIKNSKQNDIALKIDTALHTIEKDNKSLKGALPDNYFSRLGLDVTRLASLLDTINDIDKIQVIVEFDTYHKCNSYDLIYLQISCRVS